MNTSTLEVEEKPKTNAQRISGSEAVLRCLLEEGVDTIFGYPGGAIMPIYDELYKYMDKLNHILVRHEQGASHAAQGYARVTGKTGVCFATSGPGATNLITGIADAQIDSTPLVAITGQVASHLLGTDAFQETDVMGISMPVTKWNYQVTKAEEIPYAIARAFYIANSGRPGPVLIDITKDAQFSEFDFEYEKCTKIRSYHPFPVMESASVDAAAQLINEAKKPMLLVGHGVLISKAQSELLALAEKAGIPMASTLLGLSAVPNKHPQYVGMLGMHGNYAPNIKTNECDLLIAVGMRFDDRVTGDLNTYAKQAKVIHIEIDPAEVDKNVKSDVAIVCDAKAALIALEKKVEQNSHDEWLAEFRALDAIEFEKVGEADLHPTSGEVKMAEVIRIISEKTKGEAVIVTDVGQHQMIASRYYKFEDTRCNVTSGGLGTMGFALPAAMGAKLGRLDKQVIAVIGDGGFQMTIQELGTIFQSKIGVKVLILNNNFLGMVRQWQELFFDRRYSFTEMTNPDFQMISKGYGIPCNKVDKRAELETAIEVFLEHDGPYLLEVCVEKEGNVFPMIPTGESVSNIKLEA
ncbi:biosynthetic-type acetolactate synthase large subunit [Reichenbachiella carrageenanivorans]|uniref:Acetolactate synthase n=1 Tax=Reichenbachiella carrageenanivorans TaxID=2979869 RepID=A0ABY6D5W1_9BACT|nr:biosynthetic-type acetolactate synthase large subunit [Reichenbachiella carrageenanivorans]UXX79235.1 biosynthetic-type acetolactate synthase large subunit [Reichenbachiella carrageenanivorans]